MCFIYNKNDILMLNCRLHVRHCLVLTWKSFKREVSLDICWQYDTKPQLRS